MSKYLIQKITNTIAKYLKMDPNFLDITKELYVLFLRDLMQIKPGLS